MKKVTAPDGTLWFDRGDFTDDHLAFTGHEAGFTDVFYELLEATDRDAEAVVVGAHVGTWAIRFARHRPTIAYEAAPATFTALARNSELNEIESALRLRCAPVWSKPGISVALESSSLDSKFTGGSVRVRPDISVTPDGADPSVTVTLDQELSGLKVGFVLIDVEGAEAQVLRGARLMLTTQRPFLSIELHEGHLGVEEDIRAQVEEQLRFAEYEWYSMFVGVEEHLICKPIGKQWPSDVSAPSEPVVDFEPEIIEFEPVELTAADRLSGVTDANAWASEWMRAMREIEAKRGCQVTDGDWAGDYMATWFANAIQTGHDAGYLRGTAENRT